MEVRKVASLIESQGLSKDYGEGQRYALTDLDFSFEKGSMGLIGPNGAGKSTFIKILLGLLMPTKGRATVLGKEAMKEHSVLRDVGVLHEKSTYPKDVKGIKYLRYVASFKGLSESDIREACELSGTISYIDRRIGSYSAGMLQRFGFTDAILGLPKLVILDEPTSNLDPLGRRDILTIINGLKKKGVNFFVCTHILSELERICDEILILNEGIMIDYGHIDKLRKKYKINRDQTLEDIFVAALVGVNK